VQFAPGIQHAEARPDAEHLTVDPLAARNSNRDDQDLPWQQPAVHGAQQPKWITQLRQLAGLGGRTSDGFGGTSVAGPASLEEVHRYSTPRLWSASTTSSHGHGDPHTVQLFPTLTWAVKIELATTTMRSRTARSASHVGDTPAGFWLFTGPPTAVAAWPTQAVRSQQNSP
jgi:hypothetical protein